MFFQQKPRGGDHEVPEHQKATFEIAKWFMEAIIFHQQNVFCALEASSSV
jgi:hypothetical protein